MTTHLVTLQEAIDGVALATDRRHKIVLNIEPQPSLIVEGAVFAFGSSFPAAGIFEYLRNVRDEAERLPWARVVIFGHTDVTGSEANNKRLSDRRAKAVLALLAGDVSMLDAVADTEDWGIAQYQAILRGLGCNPGAIDGVEGRMMRAAVRGFQREYNESVYHEHAGALRAHGSLVVDGSLGPKTKAALRDAYVASSPSQIERSRLNTPAFAGCSELNPISDDADENRRVMVALVDSTGPKPADFPCKEGDISACPQDGGGTLRCQFYRRHFHESRRLEVVPFFDFRWLKEQSGAAHLSALTPLPDGTSARFTLYRWEAAITNPMPTSKNGVARPASPGQELGTVDGEIRGGVAFARWMPPEDFDPFDYGSWLIDHDRDLELFEDEHPNGGEISGEDLMAAPAAHPPVFLVEAGEHWAFSFPPSHDLNRVRITKEPDGPGVAIGYDFGLVPWGASGGRTTPSNALPSNVGVVALVMATRELTPENDEGTAA